MIWRGVWAVIFAILLAGSARADSTVPNLSPATNLTGGELYLAQTGASDNKLGLTTSVFCLSGGSMTLCPGSIGTSLLSAGAALGNIGAGGINSTYLASGTALANIGAAGVTSSYLASGAALANIGTLNNAQFIGYGAGSGSGAAQPVTIQAGTGASFNCTGGVCTIGATGSGGVSGPGSSVNGDIVIWNGSAGNALADGGVLLSALAPLNSPALIGTPTAPTAASSTNTTQIATTAFVKGQGYLAAPVALSSFANQANNTVVGNISGGTAPPSALTQTQLTALCNIFSSTLAGCVPASGGGTSNWLRADGAWAAPPGSGTVTSVGMTGDGTIYNSSVTGSPVTSSGVLAPSLKTQTANTVLSGPTSGSAAAPTFRALVAADMPTSVTDGTHTQTAVGTFSLGAGLQTTTGSSGTAPINLVSPDRTVTSPPAIGSGDMAGQVNVDLSTTGAVMIPAISSSVFPTGAGALLPNSGTAGYTFSSTPTINGLPWSTIYPGGFAGMVSNGTSLDAFGWPGFGALSGACTSTSAGVLTCTANVSAGSTLASGNVVIGGGGTAVSTEADWALASHNLIGNQSGSTAPTFPSSRNGIELVGLPGSWPGIYGFTFATSTIFGGYRAEGTPTSPTPANGIITSLVANGWNGSAYTTGGTGAEFDLEASQVWSSTGNGTEADWYTTPNNTTSYVHSMQLANTGSLLLNTSAGAAPTGGSCGAGCLNVATDLRVNNNSVQASAANTGMVVTPSSSGTTFTTQFPIQAAQTGSYSVKYTGSSFSTGSDAWTILPVNCSSACTITLPQSTGSVFPPGTPIVVQSYGAGAVTVSATTSTIYGAPLTSGSIVLGQYQQAALESDSSNNYFAQVTLAQASVSFGNLPASVQMVTATNIENLGGL